jgi:hypothetical protein
VELKPEEEGGFYRVNTSFVARPDYVKNKPLLWERAQSNQSGVTGPPSAVSGQSSGAGTEAAPEKTIPPSGVPDNLGGRASLGHFRKVDAPAPGQKGWGKGNLSARAEQALADGKRTSRMIAADYGVSRGVVESTLHTNEWHHVLEPGRKTPGMVDFYSFQPEENAGDAALLQEMQEREKLTRKARAGKAAFSRELRRRGFQVEGGRYVNLPDGRIVGSIAGQPGNFGVDLSAAQVRRYAWEDVAPLADLNWGEGKLNRGQWRGLTGQPDLEEKVESPAKGGPSTIGAQPNPQEPGSRVSVGGGESTEVLPMPTAPDTLSVVEMMGMRNAPAAPDTPPWSGGRASLGTAARQRQATTEQDLKDRAARALEIAAAPGDIAGRPHMEPPPAQRAAQTPAEDFSRLTTPAIGRRLQAAGITPPANATREERISLLEQATRPEPVLTPEVAAKRVAVLEVPARGDGKPPTSAWATQEARERFIGKEFTNEDTGIRYGVSGESVRKMLSGGKPHSRARILAMQHLDQMIAKAVETEQRTGNDSGSGIETIRELNVPVRVEGTLYRARLIGKTLGEDAGVPGRMKSYRLEAIELEPQKDESPAKGGEQATIGAQPNSRRGSRVSAIEGESAEALPIPYAPDTLSVAEIFGMRNAPAVSEALKQAGFNVPAGTPHLADGMRLRHVRRGHPDLTDADFSVIPDVVGSPDLVGATRNNEGLQRVWLLKQGEDDRLHIAVYGQRKGQLRMLTHYKEDADVILKELKMKGVPLVAVAKPPLSLEGDPGGQSGRTNTGTPNEDTTPPSGTAGNQGWAKNTAREDPLTGGPLALARGSNVQDAPAVDLRAEDSVPPAGESGNLGGRASLGTIAMPGDRLRRRCECSCSKRTAR